MAVEKVAWGLIYFGQFTLHIRNLSDYAVTKVEVINSNVHRNERNLVTLG